MASGLGAFVDGSFVGYDYVDRKRGEKEDRDWTRGRRERQQDVLDPRDDAEHDYRVGRRETLDGRQDETWGRQQITWSRQDDAYARAQEDLNTIEGIWSNAASATDEAVRGAETDARTARTRSFDMGQPVASRARGALQGGAGEAEARGDEGNDRLPVFREIGDPGEELRESRSRNPSSESGLVLESAEIRDRITNMTDEVLNAFRETAAERAANGGQRAFYARIVREVDEEAARRGAAAPAAQPAPTARGAIPMGGPAGGPAPAVADPYAAFRTGPDGGPLPEIGPNVPAGAAATPNAPGMAARTPAPVDPNAPNYQQWGQAAQNARPQNPLPPPAAMQPQAALRGALPPPQQPAPQPQMQGPPVAPPPPPMEMRMRPPPGTGGAELSFGQPPVQTDLEQRAAAADPRGAMPTDPSRTFAEEYVRVGAPQAIEEFLRKGMVAEAEALQGWVTQQTTQQGLESYADAYLAAVNGDIEGFAESVLDLYNNEDYYPDGLIVDEERSQWVMDDEGNPVGAELTFIDTDTGDSFTRTYESFDELAEEALAMLQPEHAFQQQLERMASASEMRTEEMKREVEFRDFVRRELAKAEIAGTAGTDVDAAIKAVADASLNWGGMDIDEKREAVTEHLQLQKDLRESVAGGAAPAAAQETEILRRQ